ncbi:hypothetical protein F444_00270 [Phytophthora nicotianae P1976]|uniref:DDE Tnp4 domain-containing protein n=1 Tax=Phytophthora nicotianae P1976 TaxID=1317066 RepID=A0A081B4T5_PHYNI|nr:hypothetical protein F444_00270 [Phytophthora nicotianae P1976]
MYAINDADKLAPRFPRTSDELETTSASFRSCSNYGVIEHCIEVIDGWLCPIRVPRQNECVESCLFFSGHYQKYGLNVQACADSLCHFTAFSVNSSGGMSDSYAYQTVETKQRTSRYYWTLLCYRR